MTYCFLSKAFGERLERMATGLIPKLIEEINFHARYTPYAHAGFMSSYFHIFSSDSTLYVEEIENVSIDKLNEILNKAYVSFFRPFDGEKPALRVSKRHSNNGNYLIVDDVAFFPFHQKAIKWHLRK